MRRGRNDAQIARHPVDANIQKASNHASQNKKDDGPEMKGNGRPGARIKHN